MTTTESATQSFTETHEQDSPAPRAVDWNNPRVSAILAAAAKCFARKGFSATTLAEIGKELGLRKSIVHYYFASKAALIHEVQSFAYHKYLERVQEAIRGSGDTSTRRAMGALKSLWDVVQNNKTGTGLNIEVWSASRRDPELKRRAAALQRDARVLIRGGISDVLGKGAESFPQTDALATLILAVLNGLAVGEYLEGEDVDVEQAYDLFLLLLRLGIKSLESS